MTIIQPRQIFEAVEQGYRDYIEITNDQSFECVTDQEFRDINFVIGCSGRKELFETTIKYLLKAEKISRLKIKFIVSEMGHSPLFKDFALENNLEYIFTPFAASHTDCKHSEALSQNIAYLCAVKSPWYCFHCADIVVPENWFTRIEKYLNSTNGFFQPYSGKRLNYLTPEYTSEIVTSNGEINIVDLEQQLISNSNSESSGLLGTQPTPGNTGGSVFVSLSAFEKVGGFESEVFHGWGWEDILIWTKLEFVYALYQKKDMEKLYNSQDGQQIHLGNAIYPEEKILLFHLCHEPSEQAENMDEMRDLSFSFIKLSFFDKLKFLQSKRSRLAEERITVQETLTNASIST